MKNRAGLSLLEVLVSLMIMSFVLFSVNFFTSNSRDKVEAVLERIEQSIRYAEHEAALRNTIMRVRIVLDSDPQEYLVESGPNGNFVLPLFQDIMDPEKNSLVDQEQREKLIGDLNSKFQKLPEFEKENGQFADQVKVIGVGSSLVDRMIQDGEFSFYVYPEGDKDSGVIILATLNEVVALSIAPYTDDFVREYHAIMAKDEAGIIEEQERVAREIYEKWTHQ